MTPDAGRSDAVFRKVSLDRLASPEQLDQLMQVTDRRGWIALGAVGAVIVTAAVWGVAGSIPENISGQGILIKNGGVYEVSATAGGRITDVAVSVGDIVNEGQVVAWIEQPELATRLEQAKTTLASLRSEYHHMLEYGSRDLALQDSLLTQQRGAVEQSMASDRRTATWLQEKIASQEQLVRDGLLTKPTLLGTRQQYDATEQKLTESESQLRQLEVKQLELRNQTQGDLRSAGTKVSDQEQQVSDLERSIKENTEVDAPYTGRILEVMAERGNVVASGEPLLSLDLTGRTVQDLEAVLYVPSIHGKQIRPGMSIQIAPVTVKQEEYGVMLGRVSYVSDFPATSKGMRRMLKNDKLVAELAGEDAPYEVHADLAVDPATVSRYRWTSSMGPPLRIQSGTLATANIAVSTKRPIEFVIPLFRKLTGI